MARRATNASSRKKLLEQELKKGLEALKSTRSTLNSAARDALTGKWRKPPPIPTQDYKRMMALEKKFGVYNPKWDKPGKSKTLTPYRKRAIRAHWQKFEGLMQDAVYAEFPPNATPKTKAEIKRSLKTSYPKAPKPTKRGLWLPKSERQITTPIGQIKYDKGTGLYGVQVSKKTKKGFIAREFRYLADSNVLDIKQKQIQRHLDRKIKLGKNQRLRFIIGQNESRRIFRNVGELFKYAARYRRDDQARATFLNELLIEVVSKGTPRKKYVGRRGNRKQVSDPWTKRHEVFRADNLRDTDPDVISDMINETGEDDEE